MKRHAFFFFLPLVLLAPSVEGQLRAPKIGMVRYSDSSVHGVLGLFNNFIVSREVLGLADAISFSDEGGLLAKNGHIQLLAADGKPLAEFESGESAPVLNVDGDLTTAIAWLPTRHSLLHWNGKSFALIETNSPLLSRVTAVRAESAEVATLLVLEDGGTVSAATVSLESGNLLALNLLPGVQGTALEQHSFFLFEDEAGLEIQGPNSAVRTIPIHAPDLTFERVSSDWLHLASPSTKQDWLLHLNRSTLAISQLPAPPAEVSK